MEKENYKEIKDRHEEWKTWEPIAWLGLYRSLCGEWAIANMQMASAETLQEREWDMDFVHDLIMWEMMYKPKPTFDL